MCAKHRLLTSETWFCCWQKYMCLQYRGTSKTGVPRPGHSWLESCVPNIDCRPVTHDFVAGRSTFAYSTGTLLVLILVYLGLDTADLNHVCHTLPIIALFPLFAQAHYTSGQELQMNRSPTSSASNAALEAEIAMLKEQVSIKLTRGVFVCPRCESN